MAGFCARAQKININKQEASIEKFLGQNQWWSNNTLLLLL
jgi:hypothetical protein